MLHIATATIAVIFVIIREVYNQIIQFLDYDSHHRVPADIEERISEHLYRHKTEYFPGLCQGLTHGTVMPKTIRWNKGWQFAVVILLSKSEIKNIQTFRFRPCKEDDKPTDPNKPFTPSKKSFNNHMVAKLEQNILKRVAEYYNITSPKIDAEEIIVQEFEDLLQGYGRENKDHLAGILFYSWSMPCTKCTTKIIDCFANRRLEIILGYTLHYRFDVESEKMQARNRMRLQQAGVIVQQIPYVKNILLL